VGKQQTPSPYVLQVLFSAAIPSKLIWDKTKEKLQQFYVTTVLETRAILSESVHACFSELVTAVSVDDFKAKILPAIVAQIKRTPGVGLSSLAHFLSCSSLEMSEFFIKDFFPVMKDNIQSKDEEVRKDALISLQKLSALTPSGDQMTSVASAVFGLPGGTLPAQRAAWSQALTALTQTPNREILSFLSKEAVDKLVAVINKETNPDSLQLHLLAIGIWMSHATTFRADVLKLYCDVFLDDKKLDKAKAYLASLNAAFDNSFSNFDKKVDLNPLVKGLLQIFNKVKQRPTLRLEGLLTVSIFVKLVRHFESFDTLLTKEGVWTYLFGATSFLFDADFVGRLDVQGNDTLIQFIQILLRGDFKKDVVYGCPRFFSVVVSAMMKGNWSLRKKTLQVINECHAVSTPISQLLLNSFDEHLQQEGPSDKSSRAAASQALETLVCPNLELQNFPALVLYSHHPKVADPLNSKTFRKCCRKMNIKIDALVEKQLPDLQTYLFGSNGLANPKKSFSVAAVQGVRGLIEQVESVQLVQNFVAPLADLLEEQQTKWVGLTKEEVGVFNTPEGQVWQQQSQASGYRTVVVKTEQEKWAAEMNAAKLAAKGVEDPQVKAAREARLKQEAVIRDRVQLLFQSLTAVVDTVVAVSYQTAGALNDIIFMIFPIILKLLPNPAFQKPFSQSISQLCANCIKSEIGRRAGRVLVIGFLSSNEKLREETFSSLLEEVLVQVERQPLTQIQFAVVFPVIHHVLTSAMAPASQHIALSFLERHADTIHPKAVIQTLSYVITNLKRFQQRATTALLKATEKLDVTGDTLDVTVEQLTSTMPAMRLAAIDSLLLIKDFGSSTSQKLGFNVFFACHDSDQNIATKAKKLYSNVGLSIEATYFSHYSHLICTDSEDLRQILGKTIAAAAAQHPDTYTSVLNSLFEFFSSHIATKDHQTYEPLVVAEYQRYQLGVMTVLSQTVTIQQSNEQLLSILNFLINFGHVSRDKEVSKLAALVGSTLTTTHAESKKDFLLQTFMEQLKDVTSPVPVLEQWVQYTAVVTKLLPGTDGRIKTVAQDLIQVALKVSAPEVRLACAQVLAKIIPQIKEEGKALLNQTLDICVVPASKQTERRGAAFCFAGIARGVGVSTALVTSGALQEILKALEAKGPEGPRVGAIYSLEALAIIGERLFEPHLIKVIGPFMNCFSDKDKKVLEATKRAAKTIMQGVSGGGLRIVLPAILASVQDRQWQKKVGAIEILGFMANCQPKQLSSCLPQIVPQLSLVLTDSSIKVQEAGRKALQEIGAVITNPEIQNHVQLLLNALDDPNKYTEQVLEALLGTKFVHHIDSPSLSLIMPVLRRALTDRNTTTKTKATKIVGNMCQLTAHKDLKPYLDGVMEVVQAVLLDPIPSTRATAAKAVGGLVKGMGEEEFPNLVDWLLGNIQNGAGFIERNGAAQGLSEVIAHLPEHRFKLDLLPKIIRMCDSDKATTREGFVSVFQYLPESWGEPFAAYLEKALPAVTKRLSDETEFVRESAIKAGQAIVNAYSETATDLLIPTLEQGIFDDNWRIRQSSIQLLGEFLTKISKKNDYGEVDLTGVINVGRGTSILATLYLIRKDSNMFVQQMASTTWKAVVDNTPKTLKAILPTLMKLILDSLASNAEKRTIGRLTLGDLVNKLGDRVLPDVIPMLEQGLYSDEAIVREGVTIGLTEVMSIAGRGQLSEFMNKLIPSVHRSLCDDSSVVQAAAAQAFDMLYASIGNRAIDEIVPPLITQLEDKDAQVSHKALNGLKQMLAVRSAVVLPFVIPKLTTPPMTHFNAKALASLAEVSGEGLYPHLPKILPSILTAVYDKDLTQPDEEILTAAKRVALAIGEEDGLELLVTELTTTCRPPHPPALHLATVQVIAAFGEQTEVDLLPHLNTFIGVLLELLDSTTQAVLEKTLEALAIITQKIPKDDLSFIGGINASLDILQRTVSFRGTRGGSAKGYLPGFCLPGGLVGLLPMYLNSLRTPIAAQKIALLEGVRLMIALTNDEGLSNDKNIVHIIGPCLRIFTTKTELPVKIQVILTLNDLIDKSKEKIRTAVPQLQTLYVKAIADPDKEVRTNAAPGLCNLILYGARIDFILNELIRLLNSSSGTGTVIILEAIPPLLTNAKSKPKPEVLNSLMEHLFKAIAESDGLVRNTGATCFGPVSQLLSPEELDKIICRLMDNLSLGSVGSLHSILTSAKPETFLNLKDKFEEFLTNSIKSDKATIRQWAARLIGAYLTIAQGDSRKEWTCNLASLVDDTSVDVKVTTIHTIKFICKNKHQVVAPVISVLIPILLPRAKDKRIVRVSFAAERALYHLVQMPIQSGQHVLKSMAKILDPSLQKDLTDFCKNVLSKTEESDDDVVEMA